MKDIFNTRLGRGFTLVELLVVIGIIGVLSSIAYASFGSSRALARDDIRKADLKSLQLALSLYKAQYGVYPTQGCGTVRVAPDLPSVYAGPGTHPAWGCTADMYITNLVPDFIAALPKDPSQESVYGRGYIYASNGTDYKLMAHDAAEVKLISNYNDEFARCPRDCGAGSSCPVPMVQTSIYAVYSSGAECW